MVGGQFDTVYSEGAYLLRRGLGGAQSLGRQTAQGGFVELTFPEPRDYPFVPTAWSMPNAEHMACSG